MTEQIDMIGKEVLARFGVPVSVAFREARGTWRCCFDLLVRTSKTAEEVISAEFAIDEKVLREWPKHERVWYCFWYDKPAQDE